MAFEISFPLGVFLQKLDCGLVRGEVLFFPEFSRLEGNRDRVIESLEANLGKFIPEQGHGTLGRRRMATTARVQRIELTLKPPKPSAAWREPVRLRFDAITWQHDESTWIGRVITLGIEVIVGKESELEPVLSKEILSALRRFGVATELHRLAWFQRGNTVRLEWKSLKVRIPTLKQIAQEAESFRESQKPKILKQVARPIKSRSLPAFELEEVIQQIADALTERKPQSVLLVGPGGVGKTAAVRELVRQKESLGLTLTPFYQTSGSALVAGMCGFGMWQERCQALCKEAAKEHAVLHLGNLVELMEVGKSEHNLIGIAGFLRPYIARGEITVIAECTPEQQAMIERHSPQLLDAFRIVRLEEPDSNRTRSILTQFAGNVPLNLQRLLAPTVIDTIERLHRRYATYSASPGRPLRFLQNLLEDSPSDHYLLESDVLAAFTRETGLPRVLIDRQVPLSLEETHRWFSMRVIGQTEAVNLIVDLLATIKAGLMRPNRPIASLLFIGPTGVGKTEMAKALAEFLFGSRDRLTRFDMSEFADPIAVQRLVGGIHGSEGLLTARIREQPFSVVLFDEFEKAHPAFFDLMLQMLGEARLTDAAGRLADFRNAVIIMTSNLGAESYQQGGYGFDLRASAREQRDDVQAQQAKEHFIREVEAFLRPEMFNRLDRLVPFSPLKFEILRQIAEREWQKMLSRDGLKYRSVTVSASSEVVPQLAEKGFDLRYGARPLKRAIERGVLAPLAHQMNHYPGEMALGVQLDISSTNLDVTVKPRLDAAGRIIRSSQVTSTLGDLIRRLSDLRRWMQSLETSASVREMNNDIFQFERVEKEVARRRRRDPEAKLTRQETEAIAELARLRELNSTIQKNRTDLFALEDSALTRFYALDTSISSDTAYASLLRELLEKLKLLEEEWNTLLLRLYGFRSTETAVVIVVLFSEDREALYDLAECYEHIARRNEGEVSKIFSYRLPDNAKKQPEEEVTTGKKRKETAPRRWVKNHLFERDEQGNEKCVLFRESTDKITEFFKTRKATTLGIAMLILGKAALIRFSDEAGLHLFRIKPENNFSSSKVLVETTSDLFGEYLPPEGITRRHFIGGQPNRRFYDYPREELMEVSLAQAFPFNEKRLADTLDELLALRMKAILRRMVLE
jgi:ATP-dependent Clp protease ATP-binding subunit ClpA